MKNKEIISHMVVPVVAILVTLLSIVITKNYDVRYELKTNYIVHTITNYDELTISNGDTLLIGQNIEALKSDLMNIVMKTDTIEKYTTINIDKLLTIIVILVVVGIITVVVITAILTQNEVCMTVNTLASFILISLCSLFAFQMNLERPYIDNIVTPPDFEQKIKDESMQMIGNGDVRIEDETYEVIRLFASQLEDVNITEEMLDKITTVKVFDKTYTYHGEASNRVFYREER